MIARYTPRMTRGIFHPFILSFCALLIAFACTFGPSVNTAFAQEAETTFKDNHAKLKEDTSLQFELAQPEEREDKDLAGGNAKDWGAFGEASSAITKLLFYGICAVLVMVVLFYILREFIHIRFPKKAAKLDDEEDTEIPLYVPDTDAAQILLEDVDKLAGEGKFADAIHTLLFRSIQDIEDKRPHSIRQSFTSREIAELQILSPEARSAFSQIGRVVEEGFFGSRALGKAEFEACRDAYLQFTGPKVWA